MENVVKHLRNEFEKRKAKNPSYSLRAFARDLGLPSSLLSSILREKKPIGFNSAKKILSHLNLTPTEKKDLILSFLEQRGRDHPEYSELAPDVLEVVSGWEYFALLSLVETVDFKPDISWIADRLMIETDTVNAVVERLERVGMLKRSERKWAVVGGATTTSVDIPDENLRKNHKSHIEKAMVSLEKDEVSSRDISGVTMAIAKSRLQEARKMIAAFRRELCHYLEDPDLPRDEVYRLNIQLFPLGDRIS